MTSNDWETPRDLYKILDLEFKFDFDPCPLYHDLTKWDGLTIDWGKSNFVNPPYSRKIKEAFINKAVIEAAKGKTVVLLLPVSTSTKIFHDKILPNKKDIRFIRGRLKFSGLKVNFKKDNMIVVL
jgi:site-specific DNA-methyltransferase (adenine-specific)